MGPKDYESEFRRSLERAQVQFDNQEEDAEAEDEEYNPWEDIEEEEREGN